MKYTEPGTYELTYTAVDECGNESTQMREVVVVGKKTVLYTDGTLIINELSTHRDGNIALHGAVVNEYVPLDENNTYEFSRSNDQPWVNERDRIQTIEFGSEVKPVSISYWFQLASNAYDIDWTNFDGSDVVSARAMFASTAIQSVVLPPMPNLTTLQYAFNRCYDLESVDFSNVGATGITNVQDIFQACYALTEVSLVGLEGTVDMCERAFANVNNDGHGDMSIVTIYSDGKLKFWQASSSTNMFRSCTSLVGGSGTVFDRNVTNKDWARIDNPPDEKGYFTGV